MTEHDENLDHALSLLVYLFSDSPKLRNRAYRHKVRSAINEALRRYIDATPEDTTS